MFLLLLVLTPLLSSVFVKGFSTIFSPMKHSVRNRYRYGQNEYPSGTKLEAAFTLSEYVTSSLLQNSPVDPSFITLSAAQEEYSEDNSYAILVDLSVRSIDDITPYFEKYPFWSKFCKKISASKQSLTTDKFLYTHDVGDATVCKVSIARIPLESYQKLELGRKLAETSSSKIIVDMVSLYGERTLCPDMCTGILAGLQANRFSMPSLKGAQGSQNIAATVTNETIDIKFVVMDHLEKTEMVPGSAVEKGKEDQYLEEDEDDEADEEETDMITALANARAKAIEKAAKLLAIEDGTYVPKKRAMKSIPTGESKTPLSDEGGEENQIYWRSKSDRMYLNNNLVQLRNDLLVETVFNDGTNIARALASLPPNILNPVTYSNSVICEFAKEYEWEITEWTHEELKVLGCGAFCAVTQGNRHPDVGIYTYYVCMYVYEHLYIRIVMHICVYLHKYLCILIHIYISGDRLIRLKSSPKKSEMMTGVRYPQSGVTITAAASVNEGAGNAVERPIVLVGKGVCYDTGGINVKSASSMKTMKHDMGGSAAALGTFLALTQTEFPYPVECWLAIVENNIDSSAYRPDDVVTAVTGDTIEVCTLCMNIH
jgi:leucyl aminopeptidase